MTTTAAPEGTAADTVDTPQAEESAAPSRTRRTLLWVAGSAVFVLAVAALVGLRYDQAHRNDLLPGVRIGGVAVGGDSAESVAARFDRQLPELGRRTVQVDAGPETDRLALREMGVDSDVDEVLARARDDADDMGLARRLWHRVLDKPVNRSYSVRFHVDRSEVRDALSDLRGRVARAPADARIDTSTGLVQIVPAVDGRSLDLTEATDRTRSAADRLANGSPLAPIPLVRAPLVMQKPKVTGFADVILIRTGENRLYHYENGALRRTYTVATGTARYPTPKGNFEIVLKRFRPTWVNPDPTGWGRSLPRSIPPGPGNPLGTRAMNLNSPGIRIHGTSNVRSLGTAASHGCIRMAMPEVEELFALVETGTPVIIITGPPTAAPAPATPVTQIGDPNAPIDLEGGG
jgi:lipoprotein-anchoring transpeptidase ErfK/SrfK